MSKVSWATAPEWRYKGFAYMPHVDGRDEDMAGIEMRRVFHDIYRVADTIVAARDGKACMPAMTAEAEPYQFMTESEFQTYVDNHGERL
jgi:hypothetical protein